MLVKKTKIQITGDRLCIIAPTLELQKDLREKIFKKSKWVKILGITNYRIENSVPKKIKECPSVDELLKKDSFFYEDRNMKSSDIKWGIAFRVTAYYVVKSTYQKIKKLVKK